MFLFRPVYCILMVCLSLFTLSLSADEPSETQTKENLQVLLDEVHLMQENFESYISMIKLLIGSAKLDSSLLKNQLDRFEGLVTSYQNNESILGELKQISYNGDLSTLPVVEKVKARGMQHFGSITKFLLFKPCFSKEFSPAVVSSISNESGEKKYLIQTKIMCSQKTLGYVCTDLTDLVQLGQTEVVEIAGFTPNAVNVALNAFNAVTYEAKPCSN